MLVAEEMLPVSKKCQVEIIPQVELARRPIGKLS
jgi:hypothetical protein